MQPDPKLADRLSLAFARKLRETIGPEAFAEVIAENRRRSDDGTCASHDHVDANMVMLDAFAEVVGRDRCLDRDADAAQWDADSEIWIAAWDRFATAPPTLED